MNLPEISIDPKWTWINTPRPEINAVFAPVIRGFGESHIAEDMLRASSLIDPDAPAFQLSLLVAETIVSRLMKDNTFPKILEPISSTSSFSTTFSERSCIGYFTQTTNLKVDEVFRPTIIFMRHPLANKVRYDYGRTIVISEINKQLQKLGLPLFPAYDDKTRWIDAKSDIPDAFKKAFE